MWIGAFKNVMGIKWAYAPSAEDTTAPMVAAHLLYGSLGTMLKPDLWRTNFVLIIGANPYVAHSSLFTEPLLREACSEVKERDGRVVVEQLSATSLLNGVPIRLSASARP